MPATKYSKTWESEPGFEGWLSQHKDDAQRAKCLWCKSDFSIAHGGQNDVKKHMNTKKHQGVIKLKLTTKPANEFFGMLCYIFLMFF